MNNTIQIGDIYQTQTHKLVGVVKEIVLNMSGTSRIRIELPDKSMRWTTFTPHKVLAYDIARNQSDRLLALIEPK